MNPGYDQAGRDITSETSAEKANADQETAADSMGVVRGPCLSVLSTAIRGTCAMSRGCIELRGLANRSEGLGGPGPVDKSEGLGPGPVDKGEGLIGAGPCR